MREGALKSSRLLRSVLVALVLGAARARAVGVWARRDLERAPQGFNGAAATNQPRDVGPSR